MTNDKHAGHAPIFIYIYIDLSYHAVIRLIITEDDNDNFSDGNITIYV